MTENVQGRQTVCRNSVVEVGKPPCTSSAHGDMGNTSCGVDSHGLYKVQRVGESDGSGSLTSHSGNRVTHEPSVCSSCHSEGHDLHRIKKDAGIQLYCTSCVLYHYKDMYCSQCFQVYSGPDQLGDPALWLTCSKCNRFCHMECAQEGGLPTDSFFFACQYCHIESCSENQPKDVSLKRPRTDDSCSLADQETLAAAQIVAIFAAKEAKEAKKRARACAAVAAKAAKLAKSALDVSHRAGLEEMRWRLEALQQNSVAASINPAMKNLQGGMYIGTIRNHQTAMILDDKPHQKMFMPPQHRVVGTTFASMKNISDGSKAAAAANLSHHQRRILPPVVSTRTSGSSFMTPHIRKLPQQQLSTALVGSGQREALSSVSKDQKFSKVLEGIEVDVSPESILESSTHLRTLKSDSLAHPDALRQNQAHATNTVEILSDEEAVDDLVDVGDLLGEGFEKEGSVPNNLIDLTRSIDVGVPPEGTSAVERSGEVSVAGAHTGQPPGGMLAVSSQSGSACEGELPESAEDSFSLP